MTIKEVSEKYHITQDTLRYYERVGMIPEVTRTSGGIRDYQEKDIGWVEMAICMRSAGLPVEALVDYVRLYQMGDETFQARLELLKEQRENLEEQKKQLQAAMDKLDYKISRYRKAVETGILSWEDESCT
ncbi:MerR family transcriptional regulator [Lachnospiraceae bacterium HCP1S3_C3]